MREKTTDPTFRKMWRPKYKPWSQRKKDNTQKPIYWECIVCRGGFHWTSMHLWRHIIDVHKELLPNDSKNLEMFKQELLENSGISFADSFWSFGKHIIHSYYTSLEFPGLRCRPFTGSRNASRGYGLNRKYNRGYNERKMAHSLNKIGYQDRLRPVPPLLNPRATGKKALRIFLKDTEHLACPDSGSGKNIISESFANENGFRIRRGPKDMKRFVLGSGKSVLSVGRVSLPVHLGDSMLAQKKRWFYVLSNCPVPLILGMPFLKEAEILTTNEDKLEIYPSDENDLPSLLWLGCPRSMMRCSMEGYILDAVADTGSDLDLISLKCAKMNGLKIDRRRQSRTRIRIGDGTETETIGQVSVSNFTLGDTCNSSQPGACAIFHVLPGLPCDVLLGRDLLASSNAFNRFPELLNDENDEDSKYFDLNILISLGSVNFSIPFSRRKRKSALAIVDPKGKHDDERHAEFYRRSQMEDQIMLLPASEKIKAGKIEEGRVRTWNALHVACEYCNPV